MKRVIYAAVCCLALVGSLFSQDIDQRVSTLEARGMYAEALAICLREVDTSPVANYYAGDYFFHGRKGVERNKGNGKVYYRKAVEGLLPLAEQGDALAQYRMARCLEFGTGDLKTAKAWYVRAADGGNTKAMCSCVILEMNNTAYGEPPAYLEKALKLGEPDAKAWQGAILVRKKDRQAAGVALLREAAKEGSPIALTRLASLCYLGESGVKKNLGMAVKLLEMAVDKGFSEAIDPLNMLRGEYEASIAAKQKQRATEANATSVKPGYGYPGQLAAYNVTPELKGHLERYNLSAGWFRRNSIDVNKWYPRDVERLLSNELPYLLFTPGRSAKPLPMVIYFGGTGEHGTNLVAQFNQTTIFSKITSSEFQKRHPCYLFAPMVPKKTYLRCANEWRPPMADLVCDAMYAVIRGARNPPVDTSRIYLTGLSYGGSAAYTLPYGYPGRFAASLPVAGFANYMSVPSKNPGNTWLIYNEHEYASAEMQKVLADITRTVNERGGEHRSSTFPDKGHNAWDKAWREDSVWDWVFSKRIDGRPQEGAAGAAWGALKAPAALALDGAACSASKPGRDGGSGPERGADGLEATCYVSATPFQKGDWWQIEFAEPLTGRITVKSGYRDGRGHVVVASIETSADGKRWIRRARFTRTSGTCQFNQPAPVKFLRVVSESSAGVPFVLREVEVAQ